MGAVALCKHSTFGHVTYNLLCPRATLAQRVMTLFLTVVGIYIVSWAYKMYKEGYKKYQDNQLYQASLEKRPMNITAHLALLHKYTSHCQQVMIEGIDIVRIANIPDQKNSVGAMVMKRLISLSTLKSLTLKRFTSKM